MYYIHTKHYINYLLKNAHRLYSELILKESERTCCLVGFLKDDEKEKLYSDIETTIKFYNDLPIIKKDIFVLRFLNNKLLKEVANITHYSETRVKTIIAEEKEKLLNMLEIDN